MNQIVYKVEFERYDEDIISVISGTTRYFSNPVKANDQIGEWKEKSQRNEARTTIIEVE